MSANPIPFKLVRIPTLKTVADFRNHIAALGVELPCEDAILSGAGSPLASPVENVMVNGKRIGNRVAIQPMEGWDGTIDRRRDRRDDSPLATIRRERREADLWRRSDGGARGWAGESKSAHHQ